LHCIDELFKPKKTLNVGTIHVIKRHIFKNEATERKRNNHLLRSEGLVIIEISNGLPKKPKNTTFHRITLGFFDRDYLCDLQFTTQIQWK
jgi:hypothetical protein